MIADLWRFFHEDDVDSFRQHLADAVYLASTSKANGSFANASSKIASSPGALATSPRTPLKTRKSAGDTHTAAGGSAKATQVITRSEINAKDGFGRTLLHHAASSRSVSARDFVAALLEIPFIDLYTQDVESGWTALHRALYHGNISVAQALMQRDIRNATDYTTSTSHTQAGGLIKIKDHEGNSPFEVFGSTIAPRALQTGSQRLSVGSGDDDSTGSVDLNTDANDVEERGHSMKAMTNLCGDEVYAFGSNKNFSLGLGDEDDRQYPERLYFERPEHLLRRLHKEHTRSRESMLHAHDLCSSVVMSASTVEHLPAIIRNRPIIIQDVFMSKLHTVVLTDDPVSNLHICGFGSGGRLGTGDEATRFNYVCIGAGGLSHKRVSSVALGQDHTIAVCSRGEVFTWGSNRWGQLGYALPETISTDLPMQLTPRQLYGHIKREVIIGAAASPIHSALFTSTGLYTFGKNEGQLGLMDADARSLDLQVIPRRVGVSVLQSAICMVSAIERATTVLLESHDVIVFTHYGWTKINFPLEGFTNYFISDALTTRYNSEISNAICKVTSGGTTICALSSFGEVFTINASRKPESASADTSTTNPSKAKNAFSPPSRVWSIKKAHTAAIDVAVGQDGSIILCTAAGSVWRKEKRAKIKSIGARDTVSSRTKDYKFVRVPNLTRVVAVRSNAFGAFTAVRRDCEVTKEQIVVDPQSIWDELYRLLPFHDYTNEQDDSDAAVPQPRFWVSPPKQHSPAQIRQAVLSSQDPESVFRRMMTRFEPLTSSSYDMWISSDVTDVKIPINAFLLKARSSVMRHALAQFEDNYYFSIPGVLSVEYGSDGQIHLQLQGADFLTIMNIVLYLYTETVVDVWHHTSRALSFATKYRQIRTELMKIASHLEMAQLEKAVRIMIEPAKSLHLDLERAIRDVDFFSDADLLIELADGAEMPAHSVMMCARCPFFDGLFHGRAGGRWMSDRRDNPESRSDAIRVDLRHIDANVFEMVLRHVYADTGEEMFDGIVTSDLDGFIDLVIEVMSVANELMLDRLAQLCQKQLGQFVNIRNIAQLLNTVAECSVNEFKHAGLEYVCLNLESMLEHRLLEELEDDLLVELDEVVQQNQLAFMPFSRSGRAQAELLENHPGLSEAIEQAHQRRIDSMRLRTRLPQDGDRPSSTGKLRVGSWERIATSPAAQPNTRPAKEDEGPSPSPSPAIVPKDSPQELVFEMDEDSNFQSATPAQRTVLPLPSVCPTPYAPRSEGKREPSNWIDTRDEAALDSMSTSVASLAKSVRRESCASASTNYVGPASPRTAIPGPALVQDAWGRSIPPPIKSDLKDIMNQASVSRISNLTKALAEPAPTAHRQPPKMSQRNRKKIQQQLQLAKVETNATMTTLDTPSPTKPSPATFVSPWQIMKAAQNPSSALPPGPTLQPDPSQSSTLRPPVRPQVRTAMTVRQTVAGTPPARHNEQMKQTRSASTPAFSTPARAVPPLVQSIRHSPTPTRSSSSVDARTSMADILAQQQTEKAAVKEAVAKRSLQEIQQEQEFQQWWDAESRRVQDEEGNDNTSTARKGKVGRGRRGMIRGSGRDAAKSEDTGPRAPGRQQAEGSVQAMVGSVGRRQARGRGRGQGSVPT